MMFLYGIIGGIVLSGVVVLVVYTVHNHFIGRVMEKADKFTGDAHKDIEAFKEAVAAAMKNNTEQLTKIIVDTKKDVEVLKQRVGGAFTVPEKAKEN